MLRFRILFSFILLLFSTLSFSVAQAGTFKFGTDTAIVKIEDIKLQGPNGERLYLAYLLEIDYFILGRGLRDMGYVIGVEGVDGHYPLPDERKIMMAQKSKLLPERLPTYTVDPAYYAIGYSLWIFLATMVLWGFVRLFKNATSRAYRP